MAGYTPLFNEIVSSTIWREDDKTRILWITMLAMKDHKYIVSASIPGLADFARITVSECRAALHKLLSPDPDSRTQDHEGRRIKEIDGGWFILNGEKYENKARSRAEYFREYRARNKTQPSATPRNTALHEITPVSVPVSVSVTKKEKKRLAPPSLEEFLQYIKEKNLPINNPERLFSGYSDGGWIDTHGNPVKNWKLKLQTIAGYSEPKESETPKVVYPEGQSPRDLAIKKIDDNKQEKINA